MPVGTRVVTVVIVVVRSPKINDAPIRAATTFRTSASNVAAVADTALAVAGERVHVPVRPH